MTFRASIFDHTGQYLGETPVWLDIREPAREGYMRYLQPFAGQPWLSQDPTVIATIRTIDFSVRRHRNGAWKLRLADQQSTDLFAQMMAEEQRW